MARPSGQVIRGAQQRLERATGGPGRLQIILVFAAGVGVDSGDKAMVSAVAGQLERAFHIGHAEIGLVIAAASFVGAAFTLPAGLLVDRTRRNRLLTAGALLWTIATVAAGAATSYRFLLGAQLAVGLFSAVVAPAIASLAGDFFPARTRAAAYGMILAGELVGAGVGFVFATEISALLGWRWPFFLAAIPGVLFFLSLWRWLPEPARGGQSWIELDQTSFAGQDDARRGRSGQNKERQDEAAGIVISLTGAKPRQDKLLRDDPASLGLFGAIRYLLQIPTYALLILASSLAYYFFAGLRAFGMIYFTQHYGAPRSTLGWMFGVVGIVTIVSAVASGRISEWLLGRGWALVRITLPGVALFVAVLSFAPAIWVRNVYVGVALFIAGAAALAAANPPIDAARLDIVLPGLWGRGEAGRTALRGVLEGGAPLLVGVASNWLGGGADGLEWALLLMLIPLLAASLLAVPLRRTYPSDVATARASLDGLKEGTPRAEDKSSDS